MMTQTQTSNLLQASHLSEEMRNLLAALLIAENPINIETAAVRAAVSIDSARVAIKLLCEAGYVRRVPMEGKIFWTIEDHPEVLAEVAIHVCAAYQRHSQKHHVEHH